MAQTTYSSNLLHYVEVLCHSPLWRRNEWRAPATQPPCGAEEPPLPASDTWWPLTWWVVMIKPAKCCDNETRTHTHEPHAQPSLALLVLGGRAAIMSPDDWGSFHRNELLGPLVLSIYRPSTLHELFFSPQFDSVDEREHRLDGEPFFNSTSLPSVHSRRDAT